MFNNPGKKIQILSVLLSILTTLACIVLALYWYHHQWEKEELRFLYALITIVLGGIFSFSRSLILFGFGEIITHLEQIDTIRFLMTK